MTPEEVLRGYDLCLVDRKGEILGWKDVDRFSRGLDAPLRALALRPRSVVEIPARDAREFLAFLLASWRRELVPLPISGLSSPRGALLPQASGDIVIATSGSSGAPKFPQFHFSAILKNATSIASSLGLRTSDEVALLQPLHHSYGIVGQLFAAMVAGAKVLDVRTSFIDEQIRLLSSVTVLSSVSYTLRRIFDGVPAFPKLRAIGSAGGSFPEKLRADLQERLPDCVLWNQYGCTEAGPRLTACPSTVPAFSSGSVGLPIADVELALGPDEEVLFRSPSRMIDYLGDDRLTRDAMLRDGAYAGYVRTGDRGRIVDGHLYLLGRVDDIVKVRGVKVSLDEVTRVAESLGAKAALALSRVDNAGEAEIVVVVEGASDLDRRAFASALGLDRLPSEVRHLPALPRLPNGKLDRAAIRAIIEAK